MRGLEPTLSKYLTVKIYKKTEPINKASNEQVQYVYHC